MKKGQLRVYWIPQVPMKAFYVDVENIKEAKKILDTLAIYDIFQFDNKIKPDYCNAGGLEEFDGNKWFDWIDEMGENIDDTELLEEKV